MRCACVSAPFVVQGYSLKSTETFKRQVVRKLGIHLCNGIVPSSRRTSLNYILNYSWQRFCRLVADSHLKKVCNTDRYTLETILVC